MPRERETPAPETVADVIAAACPEGWWNSLRGLDVAMEAIRKARPAWQLASQSPKLHEVTRQKYVVLMEQSRDAMLELKDRKRLLAQQEDPENGAYERCFKKIVRAYVGNDVYESFQREAGEQAKRITELRATPVSAGSVLSPRAGGGAMRVRRSDVG